MNAKELIEAATPSSVLIAAAEDLKSRARQGGSQPTMTSDLWLAQHILATVRPDDDEPVTVERLGAVGWKGLGTPPWLYRHEDAITDVVLNEPSGRYTTVFPAIELKSMGHLRRLVAALGE